MRVSLNEEEKKLLDNLRQIIEFGRQQMEGRVHNLQEAAPKQNALFMTFGVVHNYTEAIYTLCRNIRPQPAIVLLRSIFEAWVNTFYLLSTASKKRLVLFTMDDALNKITVANELLDFIKRYPLREGKDSFTTRSDLEKVKQNNEEIVKRIRKHHKLKKGDKFPNLLDRARACDKKYHKKLRTGYFEYNYHTIYRFFSPYAHLNARGVDNFLKPRIEGGYNLITSQSADLTEQVLASAFAFYLSFLRYMKEKRILPRSIKLGKFNKMVKQMPIERKSSL